MQKEQRSTHSSNSTSWNRNETALKPISKARQTQTAMMWHNLRHTEALHEHWYGEKNLCCTCGNHEDWRHVLTCKSLDAELIREQSWSKLGKLMDKWSLSYDMWMAMENGVRNYTLNPLKRDPDNMPSEPPSPFGTTFHTPRNRLKVAFCASQIVWDNFLKGGFTRDWIMCMDHHFQSNGSKITGQKCITKLIMGRWEHTDHIWTYRNNIYHENTNQQVSIYKTEALDRRYEEIWEKHAALVKRLHAFQTKHVGHRTSIGNLNYEKKLCWVNLAEQYISEAASPLRTEMYTLSEFLGAILLVG
jgi:hypothetical protein